MERKYDLLERLINFSCSCFEIAEQLPKNQIGKNLKVQLIRSSSSPSIHYGEAQAAESINDFIHKMKVCLKELRETYACLLLICKSKTMGEERIKPAVKENDELIAIFVASIKTARNNPTLKPTSEPKY